MNAILEDLNSPQQQLQAQSQQPPQQQSAEDAFWNAQPPVQTPGSGAHGGMPPPQRYPSAQQHPTQQQPLPPGRFHNPPPQYQQPPQQPREGEGFADVNLSGAPGGDQQFRSPSGASRSLRPSQAQTQAQQQTPPYGTARPMPAAGGRPMPPPMQQQQQVPSPINEDFGASGPDGSWPQQQFGAAHSQPPAYHQPQHHQHHQSSASMQSSDRPWTPAPPHALFTFGFGGRCVIMQPRAFRNLNPRQSQSQPWEAAEVQSDNGQSPQPLRAGYVKVGRLYDFLPANNRWVQSITRFPGPLLSAENSGAGAGSGVPASSSAVTKLKKEIDSFVADKSRLLAGVVGLSNERVLRREARRILWEGLQVMVAEGSGTLRPPVDSKQAQAADSKHPQLVRARREPLIVSSSLCFELLTGFVSFFLSRADSERVITGR